ncbi:MAG TPA: glucokinase [Gammaproteobacteria bacterium]|nr:glucokinase [Gammaproteobacteria bacterium]
MILTGDIGGTRTRLALLHQAADGWEVVAEERCASTEHEGLEPLLEQFLSRYAGSTPRAAAFGVAGPVRDGRCRATNLPWSLSVASLHRASGVPAFLLNDLEALAWGIAALPGEAFATLQAGHPDPQGNRAVIAAGTGLGQAGLPFCDGDWRPFACEGGHTDFAPRPGRDTALLAALTARFGHVSQERVVSGPGLVRLYRHLLETAGAPLPDWLHDEAAAARISHHALSGTDSFCQQTLEWFVELYGREAGNLALKLNASGGLYLGGGIAPKILPALQTGVFLEAFLDKGRMRGLLERVPVRVILDEQAALKGLAAFAAARVR